MHTHMYKFDLQTIMHIICTYKQEPRHVFVCLVGEMLAGFGLQH